MAIRPMIAGNSPMSRVVDFTRHRDTQHYDLKPIRSMEDFKTALRALLRPYRGTFRIAPDLRFVTFGSCFAQNIAEAMISRGATVYTICITEDVNSPYNNRTLLEKVFEGVDTPFTDQLKQITNVDYAELKTEFTRATDIVFTLGNIFRIEDDNGHALLSKIGTRLVRESFPQTLANIERILELLRANTSARLFVSVSPIPISGYRGVEFESAMEADCASKCQLMTALRALNGYQYIPTFEAFRWLAAHKSIPTLGSAEHPRHLFRDQIDAVMEFLC